MSNNKVVHLPNRHTLTRGDEMIVYQLGKTTVIIDESYVLNKTPEQAKADQEALDASMWAIADELYARGESA